MKVSVTIIWIRLLSNIFLCRYVFVSNKTLLSKYLDLFFVTTVGLSVDSYIFISMLIKRTIITLYNTNTLAVASTC